MGKNLHNALKLGGTLTQAQTDAVLGIRDFARRQLCQAWLDVDDVSDHVFRQWVSGKSGHYRPTVAQMVNLLERLAGYGVDLSRLTVYRENFTQEWRGTAFKFFEPCAAPVLMTRRAWPTGREPDAMRVE